MSRMLKTIEKAYSYPVDVEFTVNFTVPEGFKINLVQCRPLQTRGEGKRANIPDMVSSDKLLFRSKGNFMGGSTVDKIARIVFVDPEGYSKLPISGKHDIARLIGKLNKLVKDKDEIPVLLIGPGRWGTSTPSLGVPVRFSEINKVAALVEISHAGTLLMPELSFGTHFFQDLVETGIFYIALFPDRDGVVFNQSWFSAKENVLTQLLPDSGRFENVVFVQNVEKSRLYLMADILSQKVVCCISESTDQ
jgi:hypothetical protein